MIDLEKKVGPLPAWGWVGVTVIPVGGFLIYRRRKAAAAAAAAPTGTGTGTPATATGADLASQTQYPGSQSYYIDAPTINSGSASNTPAQGLQAKVQADVQALEVLDQQYGFWLRARQTDKGAALTNDNKQQAAVAASQAAAHKTYLSDLSAIAASNLVNGTAN